MKKLRGIVSALVTPFGPSGKIDCGAIRRHIDFVLAGKVDCLYPIGTTGEMHLMDIDERMQVAKTVVEHNNSRATAYIQVGAMSARDTITLAKHAQWIGADGIGVITPAFFKVSGREMEEYFISAAKAVREDFPVYLYNIPQLTGNDLLPEVVERIVQRAPNVVGIKYSYPDLIRTQDYLRINGGSFSVMHGTDTLLTSLMILGCDGIVSGCSCVCPEIFVNVYRAFIENRYADAKRLQLVSSRMVDVLRAGSNLAYFKAALSIQGIDMGHMRAPLLDLTQKELRAFKEEFLQVLACAKEAVAPDQLHNRK